MYCKLSEEHLNYMAKVVGEEYLKHDLDTLKSFAHDHTESLEFPPEVVVFPKNVEEISKIVKFCNSERIPITPIGAQTGLSGGCLSVFGGVALSLKRLNQIISIDSKNYQVTTEPGVITQELQEKLAVKGFYYPPDPASRGSCFIGGNIAENSGGPHAVKYGVTADYVLNLEIVLPNGEIIWTGANTLKNSTGYNLTQLIVGSEGTLGIVTKIVLRLIPVVKANALLQVPFFSNEDACAAVNEILNSGVTPSALEFMELEAIKLASKHIGENVDFDSGIKALLLIEVDGNKEEDIMNQVESVYNTLSKFETAEILFADNEAQKDKLWRLRRVIGEAVKCHSVYKEEDTVVPRAHLPELIAVVKAIGKEFGFNSVCYGHAGDGNLHVNILREQMSQSDWDSLPSTALVNLFEAVKNMGGTVSGEHGIGWVQKSFMSIVQNEAQINLQKAIKATFDPNQIMNPGKIWPD